MRRFTIGRLMLVVGGAAGVLTLGRSLGWEHGWELVHVQVAALLGGLIGGSVCFGAGRSRPRLALGALAVAGLLWNGATALILIYLLSIGGIVLLMLITLLLAPIALGGGVAWISERAKAQSPRPRRGSRGFAVLAIGGLPVTMMSTQWPLLLAFALSRPALDRLADRIAAGGTLAAPEWAGCYRIVAAATSPTPGNVALIIDASPSGRSGFVRSGARTSPPTPLSNLNFDIPVGGPWFYQNED